MSSQSASKPYQAMVGGPGQRQIKLPLSKAFEIAIKSIRARFWRSMITAAGVLLGIAFLGATLGQSIISSHPDAQPVREGLSEAQIQIEQEEAEQRQIWLVAMSLIVCTVGIANSMLMSVTERFKEIGTFKCLGATDSFIVKLFLIEAGLLGIVASVLGFVIGFVGVVLMGLLQHGGKVWGWLPPELVFQAFAASVGAGMLLTVLATIFPAMRASQMPPAAALRTEI